MVSPKPHIGVNIIFYLFVYHQYAENLVLVHGIAIDGKNSFQRNKFFFAQKHDISETPPLIRITDSNEEIIPYQKTSSVKNDVNDSNESANPTLDTVLVSTTDKADQTDNPNSTKLPSRNTSMLALLNNVLENAIQLTSNNSQQQVAINAVTYFKILSNIFNEAVEKIIKNTENCSDNEEVSDHETSTSYETTNNPYNLTTEKILEDDIKFIENPTTDIAFNVTEEKTLEDNIKALEKPTTVLPLN